MAKKAKFKFDGTQYDFEKDASAVTYGEGKLNTALNGLQEVRTTGFGRQLLSADEEDFRRLLEISKEDIWDECQNRWSNNAHRSSKQKKFGTYSLYVGTNSLYTDVVFGGQPFTISFWAYMTSTVKADFPIFRAIGTSRSFGLYDRHTYDGTYPFVVGLFTGTSSLSAFDTGYTNVTAKSMYVARNAWTHLELDYNGSGTLKFYRAGVLMSTWSTTISREVRRIYLGSFAGYVDSFRILDGKCLHTAAFTAPSSAYNFATYPDETISLLNFE